MQISYAWQVLKIFAPQAPAAFKAGGYPGGAFEGGVATAIQTRDSESELIWEVVDILNKFSKIGVFT